MNEEVLEGELVLVDQESLELAVQESNGLALISQARHALAEAKTLDDFRRVAELAAVATDLNKRHAKLMEAQGLAAEYVRQATGAANDAAAIRIEAQAKAGEILLDMKERGERLTRGEGQARRKDRVQEDGVANKPSLAELVGGDPDNAREQANRWQKVASVPAEVRSAYIRSVQNENGEVTTAGLLRFAREPAEPKQDGRSTIELGYDHIVKSLSEVTGYDPVVMAGQAINTNRKTKYVQLMRRVGDWIEASLDALGQ